MSHRSLHLQPLEEGAWLQQFKDEVRLSKAKEGLLNFKTNQAEGGDFWVSE